MGTRAFSRGLLGVALLLSTTVAQSAALIVLTERDYTGNHTATDRSWFYKNLDGTDQTTGYGIYNTLEYQAGRSFQIPGVVYTKGTSLTIRLRFKNTYRNAITATLSFQAIRLAIPPGTGRSTVTYVNLTPPADQQLTVGGFGGTTDVNITVTGVPSYVTLGDIEFQATMLAISGYTPGENVWIMGTGDWGLWERLYLTVAQPTNTQAVVWTDLLEYSCDWGHGKATIEDVTKAETKGLFWGWIFHYNLNAPNVPTVWVESDTGKYRLKDLLNALSATGIQPGNCVDVSFFLELALESLGISSTAKRLRYTTDERPFITNLMCPIGEDASVMANYRLTGFIMHQQCYVGDKVNDAALALDKDLNGGVFMQPPSWWEMPGYWQTDPGLTPPVIYGLVYREFIIGSDTAVGIVTGEFIYAWEVVPDPTVPPRLIGHVGPTPVSHNGVKNDYNVVLSVRDTSGATRCRCSDLGRPEA